MAVDITLATPVAKKLKVLLYGPSGSGKTIAALSFPRVLLVDAESGADLYAGRPGIAAFHRACIKTLFDLDDVIRQVQADAGKTWDTLVIDPISVFYQVNKIAAAERSGDMTYRSWAKVNGRMNALYTALTGLPVHVVVIAREAVEYEGEGTNLRKVGLKPDADKNLAYMMDFVVRLTDDHRGIVEKSRGATLGEDQRLAQVNWSVFAPLADLYVAAPAAPVLKSDDEAGERERDSMANREVAEEFVRIWQGQAVTVADMLNALGVSRFSEYTAGRKAADAAMQRYIDAQLAAPPATPRNGGGSH